MARNLYSLLLLLLLPPFLFYTSAASRGRISVYWGQYGDEDALNETCSTGKFSYIIIGQLSVFGYGQDPQLRLGNHCNPSISGNCVFLSNQIRTCQRRGIRVFLSIGGNVGNYSLASREDARDVSVYLWRNFLGGGKRTPTRPLGNAVLDGINFDIHGGSTENYNDLAKFLKSYSNNRRKVYLTAAPWCPFPDLYLEEALNTNLFDIVWVQFYNNPSCVYSAGNITNLVTTWTLWTSSFKTRWIFLGLPAAPNASRSGFIPPVVLKWNILPVIRMSRKYGGVMLWTKYWDEQNGYSDSIIGNVQNNLNFLNR